MRDINVGGLTIAGADSNVRRELFKTLWNEFTGPELKELLTELSEEREEIPGTGEVLRFHWDLSDDGDDHTYQNITMVVTDNDEWTPGAIGL